MALTPYERIQVDPHYRKDQLNTPIPHTIEDVQVEDIELGLAKDRSIGMVCCWVHKTREEIAFEAETHPNEDTRARAREKVKDYDRLEADILERGVLKPLIGWRHPDTGKVHILVGMRRAEISIRHKLADTLSVAVVAEDVRSWWKYDCTVPNSRQEKLKQHLGTVKY